MAEDSVIYACLGCCTCRYFCIDQRYALKTWQKDFFCNIFMSIPILGFCNWFSSAARRWWDVDCVTGLSAESLRGEQKGNIFFPDSEKHGALDTSRTGFCSPMSSYAERRFLLASAGPPLRKAFVLRSCIFWKHLRGTASQEAKARKCWKVKHVCFLHRTRCGGEWPAQEKSQLLNGLINQLQFFRFSQSYNGFFYFPVLLLCRMSTNSSGHKWVVISPRNLVQLTLSIKLYSKPSFWSIEHQNHTWHVL